MMQELPDPFHEKRSPWAKARRFLGPYKRQILERFQRKALVSNPVIGFTDGANGSLNKRALITYVALAFYMKSRTS